MPITSLPQAFVMARYRAGVFAAVSLGLACQSGEPKGGLDPATALTAVIVTPASVELAAGGSQQFLASGQMSDGSTSALSNANWSATGGSITSTGLYIAGSTGGVYRVIGAASGGGLADTSVATVALPPPVLAAIILTPANVTLQSGTAQQFTASGQLSDGSTTAVTVTYTSTGGTITPAGLYAAGATTGTFRAIATAQGGTLADTSTITITAAPPTLAAVVLTPASVSLQTGASQQFSAAGRLSDGSSTPVSVSYTATGGTISAAGLFTAGTATGTFRVIATQQGGTLADSSAVTIIAPPPTLTAVIFTPASVNLQAGATQQFTAAGWLSDGSSTPVTVTYGASGGTITSGGLYTAGSTAGTFRVIATQQGGTLADTSQVTITVVGGGSECATPQAGWIWCDDFEADRGASYFEVDNAGGAFVRTTGVGHGNSYGMLVHFAAGASSVGSLKLAFGRTPQAYFAPVDAGTTDYREIYWRVYVRNQAGWTGGGGDKLSRAISFASSTSWAEAMVAHVYTGSSAPGYNYLGLDPASGTDAAGNLKATTYNDFPNFRWLGWVQGATPLFTGASLGQWHCVESHVKLNDAGQSNGVFETWVDGSLDARSASLNWVGSFSAYGINAVFLENYWNTGSPAAQDRYLDRFVVGRSRIGC